LNIVLGSNEWRLQAIPQAQRPGRHSFFTLALAISHSMPYDLAKRGHFRLTTRQLSTTTACAQQR